MRNKPQGGQRMNERTYVIAAVCGVDRVIGVWVVWCKLWDCSGGLSAREYVRGRDTA